MVKRMEIIVCSLILLLVLSGCEPVEEQALNPGQAPYPVQEQISDSEQEQGFNLVQEQDSNPVAPETVAEEVIKEESIEDTTCTRAFSPKYSAGPYYNGPLFDAHFHVPITSDKMAERIAGEHGGHGSDPTTGYSDPILGKDVTLDEIMCFFDEEDVRGVIGFYTPDETQLEESLEAARDIKEKSSRRINLFLMPARLEAGRLDSIQVSNPGLFKGYGELTFYDQDFKDITPSDNTLLDIYDVAEKHGLIVMIHPDLNQERDIETALKKNPNVNFLLHGFEIEDSVTDLMDKYQNVYFSLDSAVLYPMMGLFISGPKEQFVSRFEQNFGSILNQQLTRWKKEIEKHPDRFVWGTDRGPKWHFDEEVSILFEEFARAFIGRLDPAVQEKYAYQNAEKLLRKDTTRNLITGNFIGVVEENSTLFAIIVILVFLMVGTVFWQRKRLMSIIKRK